MSGVLFENLTKQKVQFIPYRGAGPAMTDLVSGTVDLLVVQVRWPLPQIRAGKIKAIRQSFAAAFGSMADIPTSDESVYRGPLIGLVRILGAERTPKESCQTERSDVEALADPRCRKRFRFGLDVAPRAQQTPEGLAASRRRRSTNGGRSSSPPAWRPGA